MATRAELILQSLLAAQSAIRALRTYGVERRRSIEIIERAEAEGREPTLEEVRAELADLGSSLDDLEDKIERHRGDG